MFKYLTGAIIVAACSIAQAQTFADFANMAQQLQGIAEKMQQGESTPQSTQATTTASAPTGVVCFTSDSKNSVWATGGRLITSCDPAVIQSQITEPYGSVAIWRFVNDRQISRSFVYSSKMSSNTNSITNSYERKGKRVVEDNRGCMMIWDVVSETPDSITIKDVGVSGACDPAVKRATEMQSKSPPSTYVKIKG